MRTGLGEAKIQRVKDKSREVLISSTLTVRVVAQLIGTLVSCFPGVEYGPLFYRDLEFDKCDALKCHKGNFEGVMQLSIRSKEEISWWVSNAGRYPKLRSHGNPDAVLKTDTSNSGWGSKLREGDSAGGRWHLTEQTLHINALELKAAFLGLKTLCQEMRNVHVQLQMDNVTVVAYVREMGGSHSRFCNSVAYDIWHWCLIRNMWLSATHIPGRHNTLADKHSRKFNDSLEWRLNPEDLQLCTKQWGQPGIDLFASRINYQIRTYATRSEGHGC